MTNPSPEKRVQYTFAAFFLLFLATTARAIVTLRSETDFWLMVGLLALFLLSAIVEPYLIARSLVYLHVLNALQTAITLVLLLSVGYYDSFALLFILPSALSVLHFPPRTALIWIGTIVLLMEAALIEHFPITESIGYAFIYPAAIFLITALCYLAMRAEEAQHRSEILLADLQAANQKLQAYTVQAQDLAAAAERNRLARELHDSVTQIIFGLTLSAQAARILLDRDPARVGPQLDHMQALAQNALAEMRALIQQLHPRTVAEEGLPAALRKLAAERNVRDGLTVTLNIQGDRRLPASVEEGLFRIAQEALTNIAKHARTDRAELTLNLQSGAPVVLCVEDHGAGFDLPHVRAQPGHLGLTSISERVEALGGMLEIDSRPGMGTRLRVVIEEEQEVEYA